MKYVVIFLVLSLVVLMAEPGECRFGGIFRAIKGAFKGTKSGWRTARRSSRYGNGWQDRIPPNDDYDNQRYQG